MQPPCSMAAISMLVSSDQVSPPDSSGKSGRPCAPNSTGSSTSRSTCIHHRSARDARCRTAAAPHDAGSARTSSSRASQTPTSRREPTLKRRRHSSSRGPRTLSCSGTKAGSTSAIGPVSSRPVNPSRSPISALAASPSSETSNGMVSSWPSTNNSPKAPAWSRNPDTVPNNVAQSPPYTTGKHPSCNAAPTRWFSSSVIASRAGSLIRLVVAPRRVSAGGSPSRSSLLASR